MKINDLTKETALTLIATKYVMFDKDSKLKSHSIEVILISKNNILTDITFICGNYYLSLEEVKHLFKDCEMFPIESIKKPE